MVDNTTAFIGLAALGLCVGSFLNVLIHRLPAILSRQYAVDLALSLGDSDAVSYYYHPQRLGLCRPRSHCPNCLAPLRPAHLLPLFSYLWLRGRCCTCHQRIPLRYPLVELLSSANAVIAVCYFGFEFMAIAAMVFGWFMITIGGIDQRTQLLPSELTLPLFGLGLLLNLNATFAPLPSAVMGGLLGYGVLWAVNWLYMRLSRRTGIGYGDFSFLAAIGTWLGWQQLLLVLLLASIMGAVVGTLLMLRYQRHLADPIAFGPYLALAAFAMLYGDLWLLPRLSQLPL